jgi:hypothetical protein
MKTGTMAAIAIGVAQRDISTGWFRPAQTHFREGDTGGKTNGKYGN